MIVPKFLVILHSLVKNINKNNPKFQIFYFTILEHDEIDHDAFYLFDIYLYSIEFIQWYLNNYENLIKEYHFQMEKYYQLIDNIYFMCPKLNSLKLTISPDDKVALHRRKN